MDDGKVRHSKRFRIMHNQFQYNTKVNLTVKKSTVPSLLLSETSPSILFDNSLHYIYFVLHVLSDNRGRTLTRHMKQMLCDCSMFVIMAKDVLNIFQCLIFVKQNTTFHRLALF
jgi:hypothetical protein